MRGKKERLAQIANETDINALEAMWDKLHSLADIAALNDDARSWDAYCECEDACVKRIKQLEGEAK